MFSKHANTAIRLAVLSAIASTACVASLTSPISADALAAGASRVHLLPAGYFTSIDGRPGNVEGVTAQQWRLTMQDAWPLITALNNSANPMLCDYEHQTLMTATNGLPAPAAGWCKKLEWVEGSGLYAVDVDWTDKAKSMIASKEYKFISPVFEFDKETGAVTSLKHFALTNNPGLDCLEPLVAALSLNFPASPSPVDLPKELPMKLILAALGLLATATEADAVAALSTLQARADSATTATTQVAALTANQFDPSKHIPLSEHTKVAQQLAALTAAAETTEHTALMTAALSDARILPVNEAYWRAQPLAVLTSFLKDAKPLAMLTGTQTGGQAPATGTGGTTLSAEELAVCKATGLTPEQFTTAKGV
ncbi:MAG: phage protease [Burkholderiaceae bacterium]|nr:phage protease [Burkholderiaceae bacterium]